MTTPPDLSSPSLNRLRARRARLVWWWQVHGPQAAKRGLDLCLVVPAIVLLLPLFAVVALAIWLKPAQSLYYQ